MFDRRIKKLKELLLRENLDAVLISSVFNIIYLTGYSNFFKEERDGYVFITKDKQFILTHSIYSKSLENKIPNFKVIEISRREPPEKAIQKILRKNDAQIGIEEHNLTVYEYKKLNHFFENLKNFDLKIKRSIKDKDEIKLIEKACKVGDKVFNQVLKKIRLNITERNLAFEIESLIKTMGFDTSFRTIVAFGTNAASPHHQSGQSKLRKDQFVLMDFGINYKNYCSDMTRTIFFGRPNKKEEKIYRTVLESQQKVIDFINNCLKKGKNILAREVDKVAREHIKSKGYSDIPHSLGHGVGVEIHEHPHLSPKSKEELKEGMIFSIEPGIYIQGFGGVRIEDLFVLENKRLKQLTHSNPSLIVI